VQKRRGRVEREARTRLELRRQKERESAQVQRRALVESRCPHLARRFAIRDQIWRHQSNERLSTRRRMRACPGLVLAVTKVNWTAL
jgi:membrane protein implicated in regulation of membrane protease activity